MEIKGKAHLLFEQSGTFKREFTKLGIPAEDYDIQDNFGEMDHICDLFREIEEGFDGRPSIFDAMTPDDFIMAFFPCIRFCEIAEYNQRSAQEKWRRDGMPVPRIWELLKKQADERFHFYDVCLKMHATVECRNLRMVMENPWSVQNFTNLFWFMKPAVIDMDRTRRGAATGSSSRPRSGTPTASRPTGSRSSRRRRRTGAPRTSSTGRRSPTPTPRRSGRRRPARPASARRSAP